MQAGAASVRTVAVPTEWPDGWDLADTLPDGVTIELLRTMLDDARGAHKADEHNAEGANGIERVVLKPITIDEFLGLDLKPREFVIEPLLHERGLVMVYAWRGVGKTWFALGLGYAIAAGGEYLKWKAKRPRRVLHVCGEMAAVDLKERLGKLVAAAGERPPEPPSYRIISADLHELGIPDLATPEGQAAMDAVLGDAEVIIFDNVSTLFRTGQENELESWVPVQNWLLKLRREGRTVVIVHHSNKAKAQRGTSKREDVLDVVLNLREPSDYEPTEGARFEVHFEKSRGLSGDAVSPFEAKLENRDAVVVWTMRDIEDARLTRDRGTEAGGSDPARNRQRARHVQVGSPPRSKGPQGGQHENPVPAHRPSVPRPRTAGHWDTYPARGTTNGTAAGRLPSRR